MSRDSDLGLQKSILAILEKAVRPMTIAKLTARLGLPAHERRTVRRLVKDLVSQGKVLSEGRGRYCMGRPAREVTGKLGRIRGRHFPVMSADGSILMQIHPRQLNGALPGDVVVAESIHSLDARGGIENKGRVVAIEKPGDRIVFGVFQRLKNYCHVVPEDGSLSHPVLIKDASGFRELDGLLVAVKVDTPDFRSKLTGEVVRSLGVVGELNTELECLISEHGLESGFPADVVDEIKTCIDEKIDDHRVDLRDLPHVTVDPDDAKDLDDAVFVEPTTGGWLLWVSIADVSTYVQMDSATDREASRRGCSTYIPGRVYPMLPAVLSEDLCSLNPASDKAAITVKMEVSRQGKVVGGKIMRSIIRSKARLTYDQVQNVLDTPELSSMPEALKMRIKTMGDCAGALLHHMKKRGQLLFDLPELGFFLNEDGSVQHAAPVAHGSANSMIEAFMVAANEVVGKLLDKMGAPALYRVHEQPDEKRIQQFILTARALGCSPEFGQKPDPLQVASFLRTIEKKPLGPALSQLLLKSLMRARYSAEPAEHFGLATDRYLHFTSPIRRYPDLVIHRQLTQLLKASGREGIDFFHGKRNFDDWPVDKNRAERLAESCSVAEHKAEVAQRAVMGLYQAAWAEDHVGDEFDAIASYAFELGLFVQLIPSMVEGLVHVSRLRGDYYDYDPKQLAVVGRSTGRIFRVGQALRVRILSSDLTKRRVDMELV